MTDPYTTLAREGFQARGFARQGPYPRRLEHFRRSTRRSVMALSGESKRRVAESAPNCGF